MSSHLADPTEIYKDPETLDIIFKPRALNVIWANDTRYWRFPNPEQKLINSSSSSSPAELLGVSWFEVTGSIELDSKKKHQIGFKVSLKPDAASVWKDCPVFIIAKWGTKGKHNLRKVYLSVCEEKVIPENFVIDIPDTQLPSHDDRMLYFGMFEIWSQKWKKGLIIHHAFVREAN